MNAWRLGKKMKATLYAIESMHLILVAGRDYNLERVIRSLMRTFT